MKKLPSTALTGAANPTFTLRDPMGDVWAKFPEVHYMSMGLGNYWR